MSSEPEQVMGHPGPASTETGHGFFDRPEWRWRVDFGSGIDDLLRLGANFRNRSVGHDLRRRSLGERIVGFG